MAVAVRCSDQVKNSVLAPILIARVDFGELGERPYVRGFHRFLIARHAGEYLVSGVSIHLLCLPSPICLDHILSLP